MKKKIVISVIIPIALIIAIVVGCNLAVIYNGTGRVFDRAEDVPHNTYGLLLATSPITPGGAHNFYFDNRITAADSLFKLGRIDYIIASGGDYRADHKFGCDEPVAIRDSLVVRGVPANRIILDYEGTRTFNSIVKAKHNGIDRLTFISQRDHNERAIRIADHLGIEAVAYNAKPSHIRRNRIKNTLREYLARVKMYLDFTIGKEPKVSDYEIPDESSKEVSIFGVTTSYDEFVLLNTLADVNIIKIDTITSNGSDFESAVIELAGVKFGANKGFIFITSQQTKQAITSLVKEISKFYGEPDVADDYDEPQYSYFDWNLYDGDGPHIRIRPLHSDEGGLLMMWRFKDDI